MRDRNLEWVGLSLMGAVGFLRRYCGILGGQNHRPWKLKNPLRPIPGAPLPASPTTNCDVAVDDPHLPLLR